MTPRGFYPQRFTRNVSSFYFKQECIPVGCVPPASVAASPARTPPARHAPPHMPPLCHAHHPLHHTCPSPLPCIPPFATHALPVNRMTDRCKNITLPQLRLRAVNYALLSAYHQSTKSIFLELKYYENLSVHNTGHKIT